MVLVQHRDGEGTVPKDFEDQIYGILAPAQLVQIQHVSTRRPNEPFNTSRHWLNDVI